MTEATVLLALLIYCKIPKISPGACIFQTPFLSGLFLEGLIYGGKLRFKIDWASLIVGRKFTIFPLIVLLCIWGQFPNTTTGGAYIWRGDLTEGFLRCEFGGLIFEGAYFRNFMVIYLIALVVIIAPYKMDVDPSLN